jgi:hypothetical protein
VVAFGVVSASVGSSMIPIVRRNGPRGRFDASAQLWDITRLAALPHDRAVREHESR